MTASCGTRREGERPYHAGMARLTSSISLALLLTVAACDSGVGPTGGTGTATGAGGGSGGATGSSTTGAGGSVFGDHGAVLSITVDPPTAVVDVSNGASSPAPFTCIGTHEDGFIGPIPASWTLDRPDLGAVGAGSGVFTAGGAQGGVGTITATVAGTPSALTATAQITVKLHLVVNDAGLSAAEQATFDTPDAASSGTWLYPYDATVFARGIPAPELMWAGGVAGDVWRIRIQETNLDATYYVSADPPSRFLLPAADWAALTATNAGEPVTVSAARLSGGIAYTETERTWKVAQGSLKGIVYYWAVNTGQLMKILPGAVQPDIVFDSGAYDVLGTPAPSGYNGATPPWESGGGGKRCVACHTVSKDGSRIAGIFERTGSTASPWGTVDLTQSPAPVTQVSPYLSSAIYLALSPDGDWLVHNDLDMTMHLTAADTGAPIASLLDGFADKTADPAFSHDGTLMAFSSNATGAYPVEFWRADLDVVDFDSGTQTFSNRRTIAAGGTEAIAFPSFAPDSAHVVYQKGDYSRAKYGTNQVGHDDLYVVDVAGTVGPRALDLANGVGYLDTKNQHLNYQPTVNPIAVGGYYWVVFVSPRDYGNRMASTSDPTYENRKQLWVAAIDANPQPGQDPSHPAFWLMGQDLSTVNMSGYWALEPCKMEGQGCDAGFECCTGFCQPDGSGGYSCQPPSGGCSQIGEACTSASDCCSPTTVACIGGFCAQQGPN